MGKPAGSLRLRQEKKKNESKEERRHAHLAMTAGSSVRGGAGEGMLEDEEEHVARIVLQEEWDELEGEDELEGWGEDALEEGGEVALEVEGGAMLEGEGEDAGGPE